MDEPESLIHRAAAASGPDPELAAALVDRAQLEARAARNGSAADLLFAAVPLAHPGPGRDELLVDAVSLLLAAGEAGEAAAFTDQIAGLPDTPNRRLLQARLAYNGGRDADAERYARSARERGEGAIRASAAAMLAALAMMRLDPAGTAASAQSALDSGELPLPDQPVMLGYRATGLAASGRPDEALRTLTDLPDDPPSYLDDAVGARGIVKLGTDDLPGARLDLRRCVPSAGWEPRPHVLVGLVWLVEAEHRLGDWDDAQLHAEQALSLIVDTDQAWLLVIAHAFAVPVLAGRGRWREARAHLDTAVEAADVHGAETERALAANAAVHRTPAPSNLDAGATGLLYLVPAVRFTGCMRLDVESMACGAFARYPSADLADLLKDALDPVGTIAPGRYSGVSTRLAARAGT